MSDIPVAGTDIVLRERVAKPKNPLEFSARPGLTRFVIMHGDQEVGQISRDRHGEFGEVGFHIEPEARGKNYARLALGALVDASREEGFKGMQAEVEEGNPNAPKSQHLLEEAGFQVTDTRNGKVRYGLDFSQQGERHSLPSKGPPGDF
jgi:RimJ/RimL family protein N-acetyltransferase